MVLTALELILESDVLAHRAEIVNQRDDRRNNPAVGLQLDIASSYTRLTENQASGSAQYRSLGPVAFPRHSRSARAAR